MNGKFMEEVTEERDLGVEIRVQGMIKRKFSVRDRNIIVQLYKSLARPHSEYAVEAQRPHHRKNIALLEGVQRRANKLILSLTDETCEDRLSYFKLTMLETRRLIGDLINCLKYLKGFDNLDPSSFLYEFEKYKRSLFKSG